MAARRKTEPKSLNVPKFVKKPGVDDHLFNNDTERRSTLLLSQIKEREVDTRPVSESHVASLSESIAALGLIEPIVVDRTGRLLAGAHRLASVRLLKANNPDAYNKHFPDDAIPVRIMPFDAEQEPNKALECEIAENEHRRDYTRQEVCELAERLKAAGYLTKRGRRKEGEMHLVPALQVIVGKSTRTLMRYLAENDSESNMTNVIFAKRQKSLKKLQKELKIITNLEFDTLETPKAQALNKQLPKFVKLVEAALQELEAEEEGLDHL